MFTAIYLHYHWKWIAYTNAVNLHTPTVYTFYVEFCCLFALCTDTCLYILSSPIHFRVKIFFETDASSKFQFIWFTFISLIFRSVFISFWIDNIFNYIQKCANMKIHLVLLVQKSGCPAFVNNECKSRHYIQIDFNNNWAVDKRVYNMKNLILQLMCWIVAVLI